ncbi:hypothetical protein IQ215_01475 [Cyanobacterium stanieri LEGE 03274]|uniref:DUF4168 domain-containing protein n=1 Tax=Cyanobacterium stanieri LEGE 03274 TaxID=1828756 RepID=A0ABR9V1D0_9CHRO|nr:hypothetical protein [Cyanobacterium stanieri]MBE9221356.1 hypothetical protein [Cyanobacterium stanieri LEGE 03274]
MTLFLYLFVISCADARISSCRQLVKIILPLEEKISTLNDNDLEMILDTATTFELTSKIINEQTFEDNNLQRYSLKLSQIYQEYGENTRKFIDAYQTKNQDEGIFYQQKIINLFSQQNEVINEINDYCK